MLLYCEKDLSTSDEVKGANRVFYDFCKLLFKVEKNLKKLPKITHLIIFLIKTLTITIRVCFTIS